MGQSRERISTTPDTAKAGEPIQLAFSLIFPDDTDNPAVIPESQPETVEPPLEKPAPKPYEPSFVSETGRCNCTCSSCAEGNHQRCRSSLCNVR